jgi:hypothetical protein
MNYGSEKPAWQPRWPFALIYAVVVAIVALTVILTLYTDVFHTPEKGTVPHILWFAILVVLLFSVITILAKVSRLEDYLSDTNIKLTRIAEAAEKTCTELTEIRKNTSLSETAKAIASREADRQSLQAAVFNKLQNKDFEGAFELIDEIGRSTGYQELAKNLKQQAENYRDSGDTDRINQVVEHINKLLDNCQWTKANLQIENLIKAAPNSEKAKSMRQVLVDRKDERKKVLLNAWDDAVRRNATDRSLEILKELDLYLTPSEGLALQEAAQSVFKDKLHNLGVRFSLAVSGKNWKQALEAGREIMKEFPNSRMAEEIREKMGVLTQNAAQQQQRKA